MICVGSMCGLLQTTCWGPQITHRPYTFLLLFFTPIFEITLWPHATTHWPHTTTHWPYTKTPIGPTKPLAASCGANGCFCGAGVFSGFWMRQITRWPHTFTHWPHTIHPQAPHNHPQAPHSHTSQPHKITDQPHAQMPAWGPWAPQGSLNDKPYSNTCI